MTEKRFKQVVNGVKDTRTGRTLTLMLEFTLKLNEINDLYDCVFDRNEELEKLSQAALLHDIGKCDVPLEIVNKPAKLTSEEYEEMKRHPEYGLKRLRDGRSQGTEEIHAVVKNAVYSHHENWNGTGYPRGLQGEAIHLFARLIHVADVYDALTAKRAYKDALNPSDAMEYLMANSGAMFDIDVVNTFIKYLTFIKTVISCS